MPNGDFFVIFCSPDDMIRLASATRWFFDGTFKVQPRLFQQLFSVHTKEGSSSILPCVYALLSRKSSELYVAFFEHLITSARKFAGFCRVTEVTCDFETGFLPSIQTAFGNQISIKGCLFHHSQCLLRFVQQNGYQKLYAAKGSTFRKTVRLFMALPLLPLEMIRPACQHLITLCQHEAPLRAFAQYFEQQWLINISPEKWCVFGEFTRTNNAVEGWHSKINRVAGRVHLNFWLFVEMIKKEELSVRAKVGQIFNLIEPTIQKLKYRRINERIRKQESLLLSGERDFLSFLKATSNLLC